MERRNFLKIAFGFGCVMAAGVAIGTSSADAAPLQPSPLTQAAPATTDGHVQRALISQDESDRIAPIQVHWGHHGYHGRGHHWGWGHRHWGWHHRHWGWRHHHWHRHWHHRHYW